MASIRELATAQTINAGATVQLAVQNSASTLANLGAWSSAYLYVDLDVGAGAESITFSVQARSDPDADWYDVPVNSLVAGTNETSNLSSVTLTADATRAVLSCEVWAPHLRVVVANAGASAATLTAYLLVR